MPILPQEITVLGGGIAGLAAASILARAGRTVTVLERSPAPDSAGAGIQISPNGTAVLKALGLTFETGAETAAAIKVCRHTDGKTLFSQRLNHYRGTGCPYLLLPRRDLIRMLLRAVPEKNVSIRFGTHVVAVSAEPDGVNCLLANGATHSTPYLIGADGIRSPTRRMLNGGDDELRCGHRVWRTRVGIGGGRTAIRRGIVRLTIGPQGHLVTYPLCGGTVLNVAAVKALDRPLALCPPTESDASEMLGEFARFGGRERRLLEQCDDVKTWPLADSAISETWSNDRCIAIGDALHPMPPFLAQGGNMALEDAWVLCRALLSYSDVRAAHASFRRLREPRLRKVVRSIDLQGRLNHLGTPPAAGARNLFLGVAGRLMPKLVLNRFNWLFNEDVTKRECGVGENAAAMP